MPAGVEAGPACCSACALFFRQGPNWMTATRANAVASAPAPTHNHRLLDFAGACCGAAIAGVDGIAGAGAPSGMVAVLLRLACGYGHRHAQTLSHASESACKRLGRLKPLIGFLGNRHQDHVIEALRKLVIERDRGHRRLFQMRRHDGKLAVAIERLLAGRHLIERNAHRVQVGARIQSWRMPLICSGDM